MKKGPKVLFFDIETAPILSYVWGLWDNNVALNQIAKDWYIISWSAKWQGDSESKIHYYDQRHAKNIEDDSSILKPLWKLLDEADIVVTQNGKQFDHKKVNARFILNGMQPPSTYKHIDTLQIAKRHFGFTSNKLAYMSDKLNKKYKKLEHKDFPGFELWSECLKGNLKAWKSMELYNKHDILSLEELYDKLIPWDTSINFNVYNDTAEVDACKCGKGECRRNGYVYLTTGKYQRYKCSYCGAQTRDRVNLLSKDKRSSLRPSVSS